MRIVIVDDEPLARSRLVQLCQHRNGLRIVAEAESGAAAIDAINEHHPDIVLLDVELQDMTGFDVLRAFPDRDGPLAIMVTAHPEHAMRAFDTDAVHYLAKPVDPLRLDSAIVRARSRLARRSPPSESSPIQFGGGCGPQPVSRERSLYQLTGERAHRLYFIEVESIDYIESEANYVALHVGDEQYLARNTVKHLAGVLAPFGFVRIERSLLINLRKVAFAERLDRGAFAFTLRTGRRLVSSGTYRQGILDEIRRGQLAARRGATH
jgi:two-component system LytT family response regulator